MSHRGETLHKDVCCIADLKELGSKRLAPMVRGRLHQLRAQWFHKLTHTDYYNEGAMDLLTYGFYHISYRGLAY